MGPTWALQPVAMEKVRRLLSDRQKHRACWETESLTRPQWTSTDTGLKPQNSNSSKMKKRLKRKKEEKNKSTKRTEVKKETQRPSPVSVLTLVVTVLWFWGRLTEDTLLKDCVFLWVAGTVTQDVPSSRHSSNLVLGSPHRHWPLWSGHVSNSGLFCEKLEQD